MVSRSPDVRQGPSTQTTAGSKRWRDDARVWPSRWRNERKIWNQGIRQLIQWVGGFVGDWELKTIPRWNGGALHKDKEQRVWLGEDEAESKGENPTDCQAQGGKGFHGFSLVDSSALRAAGGAWGMVGSRAGCLRLWTVSKYFCGRTLLIPVCRCAVRSPPISPPEHNPMRTGIVICSIQCPTPRAETVPDT